MIWSDAVYFTGSSLNKTFNIEMKRFVLQEVFPSKEHLLFYPFHTDWDALLTDLFEEYGISHITRTGFTFDPALFLERHRDWRTRVPEGFEVRRVDGTLDASNLGLVEVWGSLDTYYQYGVGYAVLYEGHITSRCLSVFVGDRHAEIGLATEEPYRRRGLATLAACAYIEECLERGLTPDWQCYYNPPSENLALKLGFVNKVEQQIPYIHVTEPIRKETGKVN